LSIYFYAPIKFKIARLITQPVPVPIEKAILSPKSPKANDLTMKQKTIFPQKLVPNAIGIFDLEMKYVFAAKNSN
jgi:hypothetical protein